MNIACLLAFKLFIVALRLSFSFPNCLTSEKKPYSSMSCIIDVFIVANNQWKLKVLLRLKNNTKEKKTHKYTHTHIKPQKESEKEKQHQQQNPIFDGYNVTHRNIMAKPRYKIIIESNRLCFISKSMNKYCVSIGLLLPIIENVLQYYV